MVLRVFKRREDRGGCDGSPEESSSGSGSNSFENSVYYDDERVIPPSPPIFGRPLTIAVPQQQLPNRLDYSLCRHQVDHLNWPGEQPPKRGCKYPRLLVLDIIEGRRRPCPKRASDPQDIYQRQVSVEDFPIFNSENTAQWRSPVYPDIREECTWISYRDQKPHRDLSHNIVPFACQHMPPLLGVKECKLLSRSLNVRKASSRLKLALSRQVWIRGPPLPAQRQVPGPNEHAMSWSAERGYHSVSRCLSKGEVREYPVGKSSDELGEMDTPEKETYSVEEAIKAVGFGSFQGLLLLYAGMAWTAEAMEMMLLSFVGPAVKDVWHLSPREESFITSAVFVGMMIGAYSWGFLSDAKGRRVGFFATSVLTFIAGLLSAFSPNYYTLLLLRGLVGVGLGGGPVISTWFMEFVPSANRGLWMIIMSLFWTLGSVVEALLAWNVMPELGWRWLLGLSSLPLAVLLVFYPLVPESPRYLASKDELKGATNVLQRMSWRNKKRLPAGSLASSLSVPMHPKHAEQANLEYEQKGHLLQDSHSTEMVPQPASKSTELQVFSKFLVLLSPGVRRSTLLLWSVFFANAFTYYGLVLLSTQLSGGAGSCTVDQAIDSSISSSPDNVSGSLYRDVLVTSIAELPGLGVAASIIDIYGRKRSMAGLFALCGVFMLPLIQHQSEVVTTALLFGARASIMGAFTVLYVYAPEVYPTGLRSTGLGIANSFARVGGLVCPLVAVELVQSCQQSLAAGLFAVVPMTAGLLVLNFPTETQGRALSDSLNEFEEAK